MTRIAGVIGATLAIGWLASAQAQDTTTPDTSEHPGTSGTEKPDSGAVQTQSGKDLELSSIQGEHAKKIQQKLKEQGFYEGTVDGVLGMRTTEALRKFQESKGLEASGKLDEETASALGIEFDEIQPVRGTETPEKSNREPQSGIESGSGSGDVLQNDAGDVKPDTDAQSGIEEPADSTSPVTGGATGTQETQSTFGQEGLGHEPMGGESLPSETPASDVNPSEIEPQAGTTPAVVTLDRKTIRKVEQALKDKQVFQGEPDEVIDANTQQAIRALQRRNGILVTGMLDEQTLRVLGVTIPATETPAATPAPVVTPGQDDGTMPR